MLSGLKAACVDLRFSADAFFDAQNLFDVSVVSTLGLTDEDVSALSEIEGVDSAEGAYSETVHTMLDGREYTSEVKALSSSGMNAPSIVEGVMPARAGEIAVNREYAIKSGKSIGDTVSIQEDIDEDEPPSEDDEFAADLGDEEQPNFICTEYTITAIVVDPMDINSTEGAVSFRSSLGADFTFFVTKDAVDSDIYTSVYLTLSGAKELLCYSDEYESMVAAVVDRIETQIKAQREQARYDDVTGEANEKLADAKQEVYDKFAEADEEIADAEKKIADGRKQIDDGLKELNSQEEKAEAAFADAWQELRDGLTEIAQGRSALESSQKELDSGKKQLDQAKEQLAQTEKDAKEKLSNAKAQLQSALGQAQSAASELTQSAQQLSGALGEAWPDDAWGELLQKAKAAYAPAIEAQLLAESLQQQLAELEKGTDEYYETEAQLSAAQEAAQKYAQSAQNETAQAQEEFAQTLGVVVQAMISQIDAQISELDENSPYYEQALAELNAKKEQLESIPSSSAALALGIAQADATADALENQLDELSEQEKQAEAGFAAAWSEIEKNEAQISEGYKQLEQAKKQLESASAQVKAGEAELIKQEEDVRAQILDGRREIEKGARELDDGEAELQESKQEYFEKRAEAEQKLADAEQEIADIDMTRWYVQDRMSLSAYSNVDSDAGSIEAVGGIFPIIFLVVAILISLTTITRMVEEDRGMIGTYKALGFTDGEIRSKYAIYALSASALGGALGDVGGFILLPKILCGIFETMYLLPEYAIKFDALYGIGGPLLFVLGVALAAYLACRAELRQTPAALMRPKAPRAGSRVFIERVSFIWNRFSFLNKVTARNLFRYKKRLIMTIAGIMGCTALLLCGFAVKDSVSELMPAQYEHVYRYDVMAAAAADDNDDLLSYVQESGDAKSWINVQVETATLKNNDGNKEDVQLIVVPDGASLAEYITLETMQGEEIRIENGGMYVTYNASKMLGFARGDSVKIQDLDLTEAEVPVAEIVQNYLGNVVYMTQSTYQNYFGEFEANGVLLNLKEGCDGAAFADSLAKKEGVLSSVSTDELKEDFSSAFSTINSVVYIILIMAAGLAFVVLFTLSTTNISERVRELATIKVLGFFDREVHLYVNKETIILTLIGVVLGLPLGDFIGRMLTSVLNLPSIHFAVSIYPASYFIAAGAAVCFAFAVNFITDRVLDKIDPVNALKSVE